MKLRNVAVFVCLWLAAARAAELRLGIIGTDTSHVIAFTRAFNGPPGPDHVEGARVVAAYKGGSPDVEASYTRVEKFAEELRTKWGVEFVDDIPTLCQRVDAILLESVDGRVHLEQARQVIAARKPMFIDKPLAATLEDAREIARLAREADVAWFSSSSLRWSPIVDALRPHAEGAKMVMTWGPGPIEPHHTLELSWYGIHAIEMLYALMGTGCVEVSWIAAPDADVVVGRWKDGRLGSVHLVRPYASYGAVVFRAKEVIPGPLDVKVSYTPMLQKIVEFFRTGVPPVPHEETLEIFAFMDAAQRSKQAGGRPMALR